MKLKSLIETSSEQINNDILNHNLKGIGTDIKKVQHSNFTKSPKKDKHPTQGSDVELFKESISNFYFSNNFDDNIKSHIINNTFNDATLGCQDECKRWANKLHNSGYNVVINNGFYYPHDDFNNAEGHTWLEVDGKIFDPTAVQFDDHGNGTYETHDSYDFDDSTIVKEDVNELEYPESDDESSVVKGPVTAQVVYVDENDNKKIMLNSSYSDVDKLKRVFTNFYKLVLQPNIQTPKPYVNSYSKTGLTAVIEDGDHVGYVVKINNLKSFDDVKSFYNFLETLFTEG